MTIMIEKLKKPTITIIKRTFEVHQNADTADPTNHSARHPQPDIPRNAAHRCAMEAWLVLS